MKIIYVSTIRFPSERAHALYIALTLDAFQTLGVIVSVIAPRRFGRSKSSVRDTFGIEHDIKVQYLPTFDTTYIPLMDRFAYIFYTTSFILSLCIHTFLTKKNDTVYFANDMVVAYVLSLMGCRVVFELHDYPSGHRTWYEKTFKNANYILVNTTEKKKDLRKDFLVDETKVIVAHNAVDFEKFRIHLSKENARIELSLPQERKIVLYTGSLFIWKGVDTLAEAAKALDADVYFVGGNDSDMNAFKAKYKDVKNICVYGHQSHSKIPIWLRAADILIIPNSGKNTVSERHTSPMKLFEYMASGTPIIASGVFSLKEILGENEGYFFVPDNASELHKSITEAFLNPDVALARAKNAQAHAKDFSWNARAEQIISLMR